MRSTEADDTRRLFAEYAFVTDAGTQVTCTFQGVFFEGADGPAMRERGWNALLHRLGGALND